MPSYRWMTINIYSVGIVLLGGIRHRRVDSPNVLLVDTCIEQGDVHPRHFIFIPARLIPSLRCCFASCVGLWSTQIDPLERVLEGDLSGQGGPSRRDVVDCFIAVPPIPSMRALYDGDLETGL